MRAILLIAVSGLLIISGMMGEITPELALASLTVTITSDTIADDGQCSLREAIIAANTDSAFHGCPAGNGADTINFSSSLPLPATFSLTLTGGDEDDALTGDLDLYGNLTISGLGMSNIILDGNAADRVLDIHSGAHINLSGLTIQNGSPPGAGDGGGIRNAGLLIISNSHVKNNHAGGIFNDGGLVQLNSVDITGTTAGYGMENINHGDLSYDGGQISGNQGGGLYNDNSNATLSNLSILNNTSGGGVRSSGFSLTKLNIDHTLISGNTSSANGGGVFNEGIGAVADISDTRITANIAIATGGGVSNNGLMTITSSTLDQNRARAGGGIDHGGGQLKLINDTISNNTALDNGGGLYNRSAATALNLTLTGNQSDGLGTGGNIFNDTAQLAISNTIVANSAVDGNCFNSEGAIHSGGHNLEDGNSCDFTDLTDMVNTMPLLGPLQDNGGATPTHALNSNSPAIENGDNDLCPLIDQRGISRPQGLSCDIGAYEFNGKTVVVKVFLPLVTK